MGSGGLGVWQPPVRQIGAGGGGGAMIRISFIIFFLFIFLCGGG